MSGKERIGEPKSNSKGIKSVMDKIEVIKGLGNEIISREMVDVDSLLGRFQKWADILANEKMTMRTYCDGEPYFNFSGVQISLSIFYGNFCNGEGKIV